ncbi:hypothetical protein ACJJTC_010673 [Scirpophaga incertulas]
MEFSNPDIPCSAQIRKDKILAFIDKDLFTLNNYETAPFKNKNHAIECLIPYHIFHLTADDIKFRGSDVEIDMKQEINLMRAKIGTMIKEHIYEDDGFTPQLLLYHEQRYLNTLAQQSNTSSSIKKKKSRIGAPGLPPAGLTRSIEKAQNTVSEGAIALKVEQRLFQVQEETLTTKRIEEENNLTER